MIAHDAYSLYKAIEAGEPLIRVIRGHRYDMRYYGPMSIKAGTTIRAVDGGSDTAIIYYPVARTEAKWTGGFYEELWQTGDNVTLSGLTFDMGMDARDVAPQMIQCAVRVIGERNTFENVHIKNCLKWGMEIVHNVGHHFKGGSCTNIQYRNDSSPDPFTGYSYGLWFSGTNSGIAPNEADITFIEGWHFDNMRNGVDCSQAGNSLAVHNCIFRYCWQAGVDGHGSYGYHDLTINECDFLSDDVQQQTRLHKLTGKFTMTGNRFRTPTSKCWFNHEDMPMMLDWADSKVDPLKPDPIVTDRLHIADNLFRVKPGEFV